MALIISRFNQPRLFGMPDIFEDLDRSCKRVVKKRRFQPYSLRPWWRRSTEGWGMSVPLEKYKPADVKVSVDGRRVTVEAKHQQEDEHGFSSSQMVRSVTLPEGIKPEDMKANWSTGTLTLKTPTKKKNDEEKIIPIEVETDQS